MKTKNQRTFNLLFPNIFRVILAFIILFSFKCCETKQEDKVVLKNSSGDDEIDEIRREIKRHPSDESNYEYRGFMLRFWQNSLLQQGAIMAGRFTPVRVNSSYITSIKNKKEQQEEIARYAKLIDKGYLILDSMQNEIIEDPSKGLTPLAPDPKSVISPVKNEKPWPNYQGTLTNVGFNGNDGPVYGRIAWKFPVGLAWESRPVIEGDKVYLASPGIRNILFTLDINTGEVLNSVKQQIPGNSYSIPAYASTPVILKDDILMREMGSRGNTGNAKEVAYINKNTWKVEKETYSGHIDYRAGYAPLAANEKYMVFPFSITNIEKIPPDSQAFNHVIIKDTKTGEQLRDVHVGQTFAEPLLDDDRVFIGTKSGYVYCFNASETDGEGDVVFARGQVITWEFQAGDAVNRKVATDAKQVYFGANDGAVYCLNKETGNLIWKYTVEKPVAESFRHFSTPLISGKLIFIGSADKYLYCLDASSGELIFKYASSDWVRACPVATKTNVYFASMNGDLYNIDYSGKQPKEVWKKHIGDH